MNDTLLEYDSKKFKQFLAGFIEGQGSLSVSIKANANSKFGYRIDPEFYLYQKASGLPLLEATQKMFGTGSIYLKSGTDNTYVFAIRNRRSIKEKVIPYFEKYVLNLSCKYSSTFELYKKVIELLENKEHFHMEGLFEIFDLAYKISDKKLAYKISDNTRTKNNKQNLRKITLEELKQKISRDYMPKNIELEEKKIENKEKKTKTNI